MIHVDKDGYAVAMASFGSHSLNHETLDKIVNDVTDAYPDYLYNNTLKVFRTVRNYLKSNYPELSEAEITYVLRKTTRYIG